MHRLLRWLFNGLGKALCLLSLLACVGTAWLWWHPREKREARIAGTSFEHGRLGLYVMPDGTAARLYDPSKEAAVFRYEALPYREVQRVPNWSAVAALAALPLLWVARRARGSYARRRRRRFGVCPRRGCDLRGNASGRCSECGEKVEAVQAERRVTA